MRGPTPVEPREIAPAIDDMEHGGRTLLGTLRVNSTDAGTDHSQMMFLPIVRAGQDHALMVEARMAAREHPFVRLEIPLTQGAVEPADLSRYSGVSFEARGEGDFRLEMLNYGGRRGNRIGAAFAVSGAWQVVRVPFAAVPAWNPRDVRALIFQLAGPAGTGVWLELDNIRLY